MKTEITLIERAIIESIVRSEKSILELTLDLDIDSSIVTNGVKQLCSIDILERKGDLYYISRKSKEFFQEYNKSTGVFEELKELSEYLIEAALRDKNEKKGLQLKKVYMNEEEFRIFKALSLNLENFLKGLRPKDNHSTRQQYIFLQAHQQYGELFNQALA